ANASCSRAGRVFFASSSRSSLLVEHDLFRKPVPSPDQVRARLFRNHALAPRQRRHPGLRGLDVGDGGLAGATVRLGVEGDLLAPGETAHAGALESRGVDEHVLAAVVRLDEAEAPLAIVELHGARDHGNILFAIGALEPRPRQSATTSPVVDVWEGSERAPANETRGGGTA